MASKNLCSTASDVIDALGGTVATARLTGRKPQHVSNWRASNKLPANTYLTLSQGLRNVGKQAPSSLWGMTEPEGVSA